MNKLKKNSSHREKWFRAMRKKLGVETNAEVRAFMKKTGLKGKKTGTGGFAHMQKTDPDRLSKLSSDAAKKRHAQG